MSWISRMRARRARILRRREQRAWRSVGGELPSCDNDLFDLAEAVGVVPPRARARFEVGRASLPPIADPWEDAAGGSGSGPTSMPERDTAPRGYDWGIWR